jgi:transglutaminase-like putative cysteine protease
MRIAAAFPVALAFVVSLSCYLPVAAQDDEVVGYGDFIRFKRWSDMPLPEPHRLAPVARPGLPFLVPMRPDCRWPKAGDWSTVKVFEADEEFVIENNSTTTRDAFFDTLVYPTTSWQKTTIVSSVLPVAEFLHDADGNAWLRASAGRMQPGERRRQAIRMTIRVGKMSLARAEKLERPDSPCAPPIERFLADQSPGESRLHCSDSPKVAEVARSITRGKNGNFAKARAIYQWMRGNVRYGATGYGSARSALVRRKAGCGGQARLFVGLCRSAGVPAREICGRNAFHKNGSITSHAWAEFYVPGYGWVPVDTTTSRFASSSPWHVTKITPSLRYRHVICIPAGDTGPTYAAPGGIVVATSEGIAPEGDWALTSLHSEVSLQAN